MIVLPGASTAETRLKAGLPLISKNTVVNMSDASFGAFVPVLVKVTTRFVVGPEMVSANCADALSITPGSLPGPVPLNVTAAFVGVVAKMKAVAGNATH